MYWVKTVRHETPVFIRDCIVTGLRDRVPMRFGVPFQFYKYVDGDIYLHLPTNREVAASFERALAVDEEFVADVVADANHQGRLLVAAARRINVQTLERKSADRVSQLLRAYADAFGAMSPYLLAPVVLDRLLSEAISNELEGRLGESRDSSNFKRSFWLLTADPRPTEMARAEIELLQVAAGIDAIDGLRRLFAESMGDEIWAECAKSSPAIYARLRRFLRKYGWMTFEYGFGAPFTGEALVERIIGYLNQGPSARLMRLREEADEQAASSRALMQNLRLSRRARHAVASLRSIVYLRSAKLAYYAKAGYATYPLFSDIARRLGVTYRDIMMLTDAEIATALKDRGTVDVDRIRERACAYALVLEDGEVQIYSGQAVDKVAETITVPEGTSRVSGEIGNAGRARGPARVVLGESDFHKVRTGDVIVTVTSTPKFTPVLQKAVALVSDVGGATSHTAKVASEMGIPCVVGTGNASLVFKDDDLLEVDGDAGEVSKIAL